MSSVFPVIPPVEQKMPTVSYLMWIQQALKSWEFVLWLAVARMIAEAHLSPLKYEWAHKDTLTHIGWREPKL